MGGSIQASGSRRLEGREIALEASAFRLAGKRILLIRNPQKQYEEGTRILQKARDSALDHERLLREIQKKEILLHCVIHDLSQPLSAMRGCFSLLEAENLSPRNRGIIEIGQRQSHNQEELIRGVLEAFSAELAAQEAIHLGPAGGPDLAKCAREIATDFSAAFAARSARIELADEIDLTRNWQVRGDELRLRRIYTNLVENALRYSPAGSVVTLGVIAEGNYLRAYVDDGGPGLPAGESTSRLFGLFAKGKEGGGKAGLGLYFCKITVERWGGAIGCENRRGRGTRFWFRLPRAEGRSATDLKAADSREGSDSASRQNPQKEAKKRRESLRLLLAEDSPVNRQITVLLLQKQGHDVAAVENGKEALARMEAELFDVVILDEEMPEMGGLEAARAIREKEKLTGARIPIVAVTGNASESARRRFGKRASMLTSPNHLKKRDLIRTLEDLHGGVHSIPSALPAESTGAGSFDARELLARVWAEIPGCFATLSECFCRTFQNECPQSARRSQKKMETPWRVQPTPSRARWPCLGPERSRKKLAKLRPWAATEMSTRRVRFWHPL